MKLRPARALLLAALLAPAAAGAQAPAGLPKVAELPASARAMALGGAYMMNAGHADALFYHPALLTGASGFGVEVQVWSGEATAASASAAMAWLGGGAGIGLRTLQYGLATSALPDGQDHLFAGGPIPVSERVATVGYARRVLGVQVGVAGKLVEERFGDTRDAAAAVDLGAARSVGPLTVGLTVRDLGEGVFDVEEEGEDEEDDGDAGPTRFVLGAGAYGRQLGIFDVGLAAQVSRRRNATVVGGGVEVGYWPITGRTFVARVGVQSTPDGSAASPLTLGLAFWGDDLVVEWAWQDFGDLGEGTHRFGVRWR